MTSDFKISEVCSLAKELGLFNKVDLDVDEKEELCSTWKALNDYRTVLEKLFKISSRICECSKNDSRHDLVLKNIDARYFYDVTGLRERLRKGFHGEYDFSGILSELDEAVQYFDNLKVEPEGEPESPGFNIKVNIVDIDYEYRGDHAVIVVYARDVVNPEVTFCITYQYMDYFYVDEDSFGNDFASAVINDRVKAMQSGMSRPKYGQWADSSTAQSNETKDYKDKKLVNPIFNFIEKTEKVTTLYNAYGYESKPRNLVKFYTKFPFVTKGVFNHFDYKGRNSIDQECRKKEHKCVSTVKTDDGKSMKCGETHWCPVCLPDQYEKTCNHNCPKCKKCEEYDKIKSYEFFENKIDYITKFLANHDIGAFDTIEVCGNYIRADEMGTTTTHCFKAHSIKRAEEEVHIDPVVAFFDIECLSADGSFPKAETSPIIQCSFIVVRGDQELYKTVLCLGETPGFEWFKHEEQLLFRLNQLVLKYDPDVFCGFNSNAFDLPYIIKRAKILGVYKYVCNWSRRLGVRISYKESVSRSNQFGEKITYKYQCPGRTMFDVMPYAIQNFKLRDYSLKGIAGEFLKDANKLDLTDEAFPEFGYDPNSEESRDQWDTTYKMMNPLYEFPRGRAKIAEYCLQDSALLVELNKKLLLTIVVVQMTKTLGCTMDTTLNRGKGYLIERKLLQYTLREGFVIPSFTTKQRPKMPDTYEGAIVLEPTTGLHEECVSVLDFMSLYPSLIRGWNLSLDTIVTERTTGVDPSDIEVMPTGDRFVRGRKRKGLLVLMEEELMKERSATKKKMKSYPKGSLEYNVFDGKQVRLKLRETM